MSISLKELQEYFQSYLLEGDNRIEQWIVTDSKIDSTKRLEIYGDAYYLRLLENLGVAFPVIKKLLGEEQFEKIGRDYIDAYPSNHFSIRLFGRHLSDYLASCLALDPVYAEIAAFEWALMEADDAADAHVLSVDEMSTIPPTAWATMLFETHPSVRLVSCSHNAPDLWRAIDAGEPVPAIENLEMPVMWLIWRFEGRNFFAPLTPQELAVVNDVQSGKTFAEICENLCQWLEEEEVIQFAASTLRNWVNEGLFSKVLYSDIQDEEISEYDAQTA